MLFNRKLISVINISIILFMACACNYNNSKAIDRGLENFIELLDEQGAEFSDEISLAHKIKENHRKGIFQHGHKEKVVGVFNNEDTKKAQSWMRDNEEVIIKILDRIGLAINGEVSEINELSRNAYLDQDRSKSLMKYILTYFKLQYLRNDIRKSIVTLSPLSFIVHSTALAEDTESLVLRKKIEEKLLMLVGVGIVVDQDFKEVKSIIQNFKKNNHLPESLRSILSRTDKNVKKELDAHTSNYKVSKGECSINSQDDKCKQILETRSELMAQYKNVTFLYTPGQKYFLITKVLTLIGNMTWGMANTLIGAGVVLVTMAVSPFTKYVDFPSFHLAASGMQIYVDVSGMSPRPGKLSLGLFELDNHSSFEFASYHEAGHAIQSAILGPFYLPAVLVTYAISGFDNGAMEILADNAAEASDKWL